MRLVRVCEHARFTHSRRPEGVAYSTPFPPGGMPWQPIFRPEEMNVTTPLEWCIEARKKLKLGALKRDTLKIPDRAKAVQKSLQVLREKNGNPQKLAGMEKRFFDISQKLMAMGEKQQVAQMKVEAQRLEVLAAEIDLLAATDTKSRTKAEKNLEKANGAMTDRQGKYKERYLTVLAKAKNELLLLRAIPFADPTALTRQIADAQEKTITRGSEDFTAALDLLSGSTVIFETSKANAQKLQEEELLNVAQQPHYESKVRKANEVLVELQKVPGTEKYVIELQGALKLGQSAIRRATGSPLTTDLFDAGYTALTRLVPSTGKVRSRALKAAAKSQKANSKDTEVLAAEEAARLALSKLTKPVELLGSEAISDLSSEIASALISCGTIEGRPAGLQKLGGLKTRIEGIERSRTSLRDGTAALLLQAETARDQLLYAATDDDRVQLRQPVTTLRLARTLYAALEFGEASRLLDEALLKLNGMVATSGRTPAKLEEKWTDLAEVLKQAKLDAALLKSRRAKLGMPVPFVLQMESELGKVEKNAALDWNLAINTLEAIAAQLKTSLTAQDGYESFAQVRGTEVDKVTPMMERAQTALGRLEIALRGKDDSDSTVALAREQLAAASTAWNERLLSAHDATLLDAASARTEFETLAARFQKYADSPDQLEQALAEGRRDALMKRLEASVTAVQLLLDTLRAASASAAEPLLRQLASIRKSAGSSVDMTAPGGPLDQLAALKTTVAEAIAEKGRELEQARVAAQFRYEAVKNEIKALRILADESMRSHNKGVFEPFFDSLDEELKDLRGMVDSSSVATTAGAVHELDSLSRRTRQLQAEVLAEPARGDESKKIARELLGKETLEEDEDEYGLAALFDESPKPNFRLVMDAISTINKRLGNKQLGKCMPEHKLRLQEEFKTLREDVYLLPPDEAFAKLKAFNDELSGVLARALDASISRSNFSNIFGEVQGRFIELGGIKIGSLRGRLSKIRKEPTAYLKELEERLRATQAMVNEPQKEQRALSQLLKIRVEIMRVLEDKAQDDPELLVKKEKEAQARAFQHEKEVTRWEALVHDFKEMDYKRAHLALKNTSGSDVSQARDLDRMLSQAEEVFKDSGNFIGAVELLNNAKLYALRIQGHPKGLKAASRDELPKVRSHWKAAVTDFNASVTELVKKITDTVAETPPPVPENPVAEKTLADAVRASTNMLNELKGLFDPNIMDGPIAVMTSSAAKLKQREAREVAMRNVNQYRELLRTNPVLLKLMDGSRPFGTVDFYGLNAALRDLDLNIQRAV